MSLQDWLNAGWIHPHTTSRKEIAQLLAAVDQDLGQCRLLTSADWILSIGHNAVLRIATIALFASGFRIGRERHHERTVASLQYTLGLDANIIEELQKYRTKRNIANYEVAGRVTDEEATGILERAHMLHRRLIAWLLTSHPELMKE